MVARVPKSCWLLTAALLAACAHPPPQSTAALRNVAPSGFQLETFSPTNQAQAYALCQAAWFAEARGAATIGLSNTLPRPASIPDWTLQQTDITFNPAAPPSPALRVVAVAPTAESCRRARG